MGEFMLRQSGEPEYSTQPLVDVLRRLDNGDPEYEEKSKCVVLLNDFMVRNNSSFLLQH